SKIENTSYTVNSIDFDHTLAKDAIQTLTDMAGGYEFGVDNSREFYFRPIDTDTHYFYWVGKHYQDIEIEEDPLSVRNRLYIKAGEIQSGGSNIIGYVEDNDSISQYGLREEVITAPEILNSDDAVQWANLILQEKKEPKVIARLKNVFLDATKAKIEPKGKVKVTVYDGTEYNLQIKRASYSISAEGILAELELGSLIIPLEEHFVNLIKEVNEEKRLGDKRAEQLYTEKASASHNHIRSDVTDFWNSPFWSNIPDKPSTFPPEAHNHDERYFTESEHINDSQGSQDGGKPIKLDSNGKIDLSMIYQGPGSGLDADKWDGHQFADYLNQAVKSNSSPTFANLTISTNLTTPKLTIGSYYLNSLVANNKVPDSDKWDGHQFADYLNQAVKSNSSPTFANLTISTNLTTPKLTIGSRYLSSLVANNKVPDSDKIDGREIYVSNSSPSGGANGDIWLEY
ncbi:MAG: hypothetical protein ACTSPB_23555, partial [Candidatus Thorarchaeota archaeon]